MHFDSTKLLYSVLVITLLVLPFPAAAIDYDGFKHLGEGECRQADGKYGVRFSTLWLQRGGPGLILPGTPENLQKAITRCLGDCKRHSKWCYAAEVYPRHSPDSFACALVTDRKRFEETVKPTDRGWWAVQSYRDFDGEEWRVTCDADRWTCAQSNWGGGSLSKRKGHNCFIPLQ